MRVHSVPGTFSKHFPTSNVFNPHNKAAAPYFMHLLRVAQSLLDSQPFAPLHSPLQPKDFMQDLVALLPEAGRSLTLEFVSSYNLQTQMKCHSTVYGSWLPTAAKKPENVT